MRVAGRDNYFAALLPLSCKWGTNYAKDELFAGSRSYAAPADGNLIRTTDADGNPADYNNWFYLISDDNILYYSTAGENDEYRVLFKDLCGAEVQTADMYLDETTTVEKRNAIVRELTSRESPLGIRQINLSGNVGHMSAWFYGHSTTATLDWLAAQTRESEMARSKLDLNKPFVRAAEQLTDSLHVWQKKARRHGDIHSHGRARKRYHRLQFRLHRPRQRRTAFAGKIGADLFSPAKRTGFFAGGKTCVQ